MPEVLNIGDEIVVVYPHRLAAPTKAKIIAFTNVPGKMIGVQFNNPVGLHTCDGRGPDRYCMWIHPSHLLTLQRGEQLLREIAAREQARKQESQLMLELDGPNTKLVSK